MGVISVVAAAAAAWIFGAVWYGMLGARWAQAQGLEPAEIKRGDPVPYIGSFVCAVVVAGMTRHIMATGGIHGGADGFVTGLGLGLFVAAPWIVTNVLFSQKPRSLVWMDGAYPAFGMALMGLVLGLF